MTIKIGDKVPSFNVIDQNGAPFTQKDLIGKISILYFYPRDNTPGCTKEACDFRDRLAELTKKGINVIGVSPDSTISHQKFIQKHSLNFTLLSDEETTLAKAFGVFKNKTIFGIKSLSIERSSFVIDKDGRIVWMERKVKVDGHVDRLLSAIQMLIQ